MARYARIILSIVGALFTAAAFAATHAADQAEVPALENSVVKIFSTMRYPDPFKPWTKQAPSEATASGVVIEGKRILTNAHAVLYASQVQIQANAAGDKLSATVLAVAPGISTGEIDKLAARLIADRGGKSPFLGLRGFPGSVHLGLRSLKRALELQMGGDEVDDRRWQIPVKLFCGAGELEGRGQRGVLTILQLLRDDVDTDLVVFEAGYGQQDCALPQVGGKLLEHGSLRG